MGILYLKKIPRHRQYNAVLVKSKHEYVGEVRGVIVRKREEKGKVVVVRKPPLVKSEIMGAINKAHLELGDAIFDKKKAVQLIFKKVKEEADKHGCTVPKAPQILRYYMEYINKLKNKRNESQDLLLLQPNSTLMLPILIILYMYTLCVTLYS